MLIDRFENKIAEEELVLAFEYGDELDAGETLIGPPAVDIAVLSGMDADPGNLLNGTAAIVGSDVLVPVKAGVSGVDYRFKVVCPTSNADKTLARIGRLYVEPA